MIFHSYDVLEERTELQSGTQGIYEELCRAELSDHQVCHGWPTDQDSLQQVTENLQSIRDK